MSISQGCLTTSFRRLFAMCKATERKCDVTHHRVGARYRSELNIRDQCGRPKRGLVNAALAIHLTVERATA